MIAALDLQSRDCAMWNRRTLGRSQGSLSVADSIKRQATARFMTTVRPKNDPQQYLSFTVGSEDVAR